MNVKQGSSASGEATKARIVEATLTTIRQEGIVGTSARAIARTGDFNQALIFYHFDSIENLVFTAVSEMGARRTEKHRAELERATSFLDLVAIARALHEDDSNSDNMAVLAQAFAGAARGDSNDDMGSKLYDELELWSQMLAETIERVLSASQIAPVVPHRDIADAMSALFIGIELLDDLDPTRGHAQSMFDSLEALAKLLGPFLR